ncbi:MAG TPA: asparagine synthase (glutamine-hydrolyzing) [Burkholderiales bacterium]
MCGIAGFAGREPSQPSVERAIGALRHRGPDDAGAWADAFACLGFARLSIIDVSGAGHQPMESHDGRYVLVFNGEIYNFPELRRALDDEGVQFRGHSDTEVLLETFARQGFEACLAKLRGMFAFSIWDRHEKTLYCARDRLGVKPLVYAQTSAGFAFASEIQALFALEPGLPREPDYVALDHYLTFQYIPAPMSGFRAIRKLPPAHAMVIREGRVERIFRYWDIDPDVRSTLSFAQAGEALREKILEATRIRLVSDVPLGAFLSGGIDSSITVAAMARLGHAPLKTFSIGFEDERFNELPFAAEVARHVGSEHHEMMVHANAADIMPRMIDHLGEPLADNSIIPTYYVSEFARKHVTVALTGDGGDEVFAGYRRFYQMRRIAWLAQRGLIPAWQRLRAAGVRLERWLRPEKPRAPFPSTRADQALEMEGLAGYKHLLAFIPDEEKSSLLTPEFRAASAASDTQGYLEAAWRRAEGAEMLNRLLYVDLSTYLPEDILFKVDIASMANSLECRSPFLDHKVIEFAFSLPGRYKLSARGRHKRLLKEAFAEWLPPGFMERPKQGFSVPLARWLREDLAAPMRAALLENRTLARWFDRAVVARYVEEHVSGRASHSTRLWPLFVLGLWAERFRVA